MAFNTPIGPTDRLRKDPAPIVTFASGEHDEHAARELHLHIDNSHDLHRQMHEPIIKNLMHKKARGIYDSGKAHKLFGYLAEAGAKSYHKEHIKTGKWHEHFNTATRHEVARRLRDQFEGEAKLGNYDHLVPKKYAGKPIKHADEGADGVAKFSDPSFSPRAYNDTWREGRRKANAQHPDHHAALKKHGFEYVKDSGDGVHHYAHKDGRTALHHKGTTIVSQNTGPSQIQGGSPISSSTHTDAKDLDRALGSWYEGRESTRRS